MKQQINHRRVDYHIIIAAIFLSAFGLMMYYSSCMDVDKFVQQGKFILIGIGIMLGCQFLDYEWLKPVAIFGYPLSIILILMLKIPGIGVTEEGVTRWIRVAGIQLQVSEPIKVLLIVFFAHYIVKNMFEVNTVKGVLKIWMMAGVIGGLLLIISSNLSACLILLMITFCITFISSNQKLLHIIVFTAAITLVVFLYCYFRLNPPTLEQMEQIKGISYQLARIIAWTDPIKYEDINGYQTVQGLYAIGAGGLVGKGLGQGTQKYMIPKPENDMIVCVIAEELGLLGVTILIFLYLYLIFYIMTVATGTKDIFGRLICAGVMFNIAFQAFVNIGVATAFLPNTGVTLPFVSGGGSAILVVFAQLAVVLSVFRKNMKRVDEKAVRQENRG